MASEWKAEQPLGLVQISTGLGIRNGTLGARNHRGQMPPPDGRLSAAAPYWYTSTVIAWAIEEGYVPKDFDGDWDDLVAARRATAELNR